MSRSQNFRNAMGVALADSAAATEAIALFDRLVGSAGDGAIPVVTGLAKSEKGDGVHKTVLTLTNLSIAMVDAGVAGCHGSQKVYDFPEGHLVILGAHYDLTTLAGAGGIADTAALVGALGTAAVSAADATLTTTEADLIASTVGTLAAGAGNLEQAGGVVATPFDGSAGAKDAFLNLAVPDAGSTANDTITVNGTITILWTLLGDD